MSELVCGGTGGRGGVLWDGRNHEIVEKHEKEEAGATDETQMKHGCSQAENEKIKGHQEDQGRREGIAKV